MNNNPHIRIHCWLEKTGGVFFGSGRVQLLNKIDECGSLRKAAEELGMSYRAAWGKIKKTEELLGDHLIEKISNKEGFRLTPLGRNLIALYSQWESAVTEFAFQEARKLFPWALEKSDILPPHEE